MNAVNGQIGFGTGGNIHFGPQIRVLAPASTIQALGIGAGAASIPTAGFIRVPFSSTEAILASINQAGLLNVPLITYGATEKLTIGATGVLEMSLNVSATGIHRLLYANINEYEFGATATDWQGNDFNDAGGANFRSGATVAGVKTYNNVDPLAVYGNLPDANTDVVVGSGPYFVIASSNAAGRTYALVPTGARYGDALYLANRSGFTCTVNNTGTGMGVPSGTLITAVPTATYAFRFGSGYWEYETRVRVMG